MSQPTLSADEAIMLAHTERQTYLGSGAFLKAGRERDRLKRLGLIVSGPRNPMHLNVCSGRGARWRVTAAGSDLAISLKAGVA